MSSMPKGGNSRRSDAQKKHGGKSEPSKKESYAKLASENAWKTMGKKRKFDRVSPKGTRSLAKGIRPRLTGRSTYRVSIWTGVQTNMILLIVLENTVQNEASNWCIFVSSLLNTMIIGSAVKSL